MHTDNTIHNILGYVKQQTMGSFPCLEMIYQQQMRASKGSCAVETIKK